MRAYPSLAEGTGLENRQGINVPRGFESLSPRHVKINTKTVNLQLISRSRAVRSARRAHNPKVEGSNPSSATIFEFC